MTNKEMLLILIDYFGAVDENTGDENTVYIEGTNNGPYGFVKFDKEGNFINISDPK